METFVALFAGVNVSGANRLPMADLRVLAQGFGWSQVATYIASGNLVFRTDSPVAGVTDRLSAGVRDAFGIAPPVLVLTASDFRARIAACPFSPDAGKAVHGFFAFGPVTVDPAAVEALRAPDEALVGTPGMVWLHAPSGIGRSRLADRLHKVVTGARLTARNLRTIGALGEMLDARAGGC